MNIACFGYRSWAKNIYLKLQSQSEITCLVFNKLNNQTYKTLKAFKPKFVLFYGWSSFIPNEITNDFDCLMLHPSNLPQFRGGSPIQNQIIRGINKTKISIFLINNKIDQGDILLKDDLNLEGYIDEIFKRIEQIGFEMTIRILNGNYKRRKQSKQNITIFKRRKPKESEITLKELKEKDSKYLYNKIRMLSDPYPNAYIVTSDQKKLIIKKVEIKNR